MTKAIAVSTMTTARLEPDCHDVDGSLSEGLVKIGQERECVPAEEEILEDRPRPIPTSPLSGCPSKEEEGDE